MKGEGSEGGVGGTTMFIEWWDQWRTLALENDYSFQVLQRLKDPVLRAEFIRWLNQKTKRKRDSD